MQEAMTMSKNVWNDIDPAHIAELEKHWAQHHQEAIKAVDALQLGGQSVLDIGCGTGQFYYYLASKYRVYCGVDLSKNMLMRFSETKPVRQLHQGSIFDLAKKRYSATCVFCFSLLIHFDVKEVKLALENLNAAARECIVFNVYLTTGPTTVIPNASMGSQLLFINKVEMEKLLKTVPHKSITRLRYTKMTDYLDILKYERYLFKLVK